jgi:hypothetical protein
VTTLTAGEQADFQPMDAGKKKKKKVKKQSTRV